MGAEASALAAFRANDVDHQAIIEYVEAMKEAHKDEGSSKEAGVDLDLHQLIYEASHNVVLLHINRALADLLRSDILLEQHIAIAEAVIAAKPDELRKNCGGAYISFAFENIKEIRLASERHQSSLHRIARSDFLARRTNSPDGE